MTDEGKKIRCAGGDRGKRKCCLEDAAAGRNSQEVCFQVCLSGLLLESYDTKPGSGISMDPTITEAPGDLSNIRQCIIFGRGVPPHLGTFMPKRHAHKCS